MTFEDRFRWSIEMQELHAIPLYESHFDIEEIIEVDKEGDAHRALKLMDFSGLDKIIEVEQGHQIHIAQRFRRPYYDDEQGWTKPDFSIRLQSYDSGASEYDKLLAAHQGWGNVPKVYGFGRAPYGRQVAKANGFEEFYLIDLHRFLTLHQSGDIELMEKAPNGDGSVGAYFSLDELWSCGCIITSWGAVAPSSDPESITAYTDGGEHR